MPPIESNIGPIPPKASITPPIASTKYPRVSINLTIVSSLRKSSYT
jgi:hypothetical protein